MDLNELQILIEEKREELNQLVLTNLGDLNSDDILKLSKELDRLIISYLKLSSTK